MSGGGVLSDSFRAMGTRKDSWKTHQSVHVPRPGPKIKMEEVELKMGRWRGMIVKKQRSAVHAFSEVVGRNGGTTFLWLSTIVINKSLYMNRLENRNHRRL